MEKLRFMRDLTYFTLIFIIFIMLQGAAFAAESPSEGHSRGPEKHSGSEIGENQSKVSEYKQDRQKIRVELELQREEYQKARKDFQKVKNKINSEELNPNSDEALNAIKTYLNSSISYMIAHLSNVKNNIEYSNGNEKIVISIDEKIKLLETEKAEVANASSEKELAAAVRLVRGTWDDAEKTSLEGAGQIVSEKVEEFLNKSEALSTVLDKRIQGLNSTADEVSDLSVKLSSYKSYLKSAQDKKKDADAIYANQNATRKELVEANNYLVQSISDINKANKLLKDIFEELKNIRYEEA